MESLREIYISGPGPSSSHTIGPMKAALDFSCDLKNVDVIDVFLYGSLALTGAGHGTDVVITKALKDFKSKIHFLKNKGRLLHPNTMVFVAKKDNKIIKKQKYFSVGGGKIIKQFDDKKTDDLYKFKTFNDLKKYIEKRKISLVDFINETEDKDFDNYLCSQLSKMFKLIERNLKISGVLPGPLKTKRVAKDIFAEASILNGQEEKHIMLMTAFAYACSEGNAANDEVVTAPTCGSCGVLPSVLYYEYKYGNCDIPKIIDAMKVAGVFGNICKQNASISGAVLGCQAEVGVATAMAAAALCYIHDLSLYQTEYAAECALEHFLGLTCDPVGGYVHIPCIERNGVGAVRAYSSYLYAKNIAPHRKNKVSFDDVVSAMKETGLALHKDFKETALGGLARLFKR